MKPVRRVDSTSQSCSCTSCLYKSESEQPSIRKYVAHGSRIDRLFYGKYIPLRERKLLNRLVRTRAVYDDLRARLISDSTLSLDKNADLRPGKHHRVIKTLDSEKSGAILELVDIIDKGAALGPKKLSDCCSCCSCSSKSKMFDRKKKEQRGKKVYTRTYEKEYGVKGQTGTEEGLYASHEREFGKTGPGRTGERYNKRGVRFKAKRIRSEPCTCTFKFSGLIKKHSKAMFTKIRPPPLEEPILDTEEQYVVEETKKKKIAGKTFQKYKDLRGKLEQDIRKMNEAKANMKQNLQLRAKKSLEQVKQVKNKIKNDIESGVRKSIQIVKGLHPKEAVETLESLEYPEPETMFKIKKDSIVKFKEYLKRKEMMKDWECNLECEPDICVPDECFKIIKLRRSHKRNRQRDHKPGTRYEVIKREIKVGGAPVTKSNSGIQAEQIAITTETRIKKHKPILRIEGTNQVMDKRLIFQSERVHKGERQKGTNKNIKKLDKSSFMLATRKEKNVRDTGSNKHIETKSDALRERGLVKKSHSPGRQAVRIKSSLSFDVEFYKNRPEAKLSRSSQPGIRMTAPRRKRRQIQRPQELNIASKSSLESSQGTVENIKTRMIQTDKFREVPTTSEQGHIVSKISQCECKRRFSNVKTNTNYGSKSVSSITTNVAKFDKSLSKEVKQKGRLSQISFLPPARLDTFTSEVNKSSSHHKQAVRIGSTFSFSVEFYKNDNQQQYVPKASAIIDKVKQTHSKHSQIKRRIAHVKGTSTKTYNQVKTTLRRCFCTLTLNKNVKTKEKAPLPLMMDKYVETKKNRLEPSKIHDLLPYECEPGICIPDNCDPILCKKILDSRKQRFKRGFTKSIGSYTGSRKTKSTSSIVSRPFASARAKIVQSSTVPTKVGSTSTPRRYKNNVNLGRNELIKTNINASERQAVRIGSSFSFNIEFYKNKQNPYMAIPNKPSLSSMPGITYKEQKIKQQKKQDKKRNKSVFTHVMKIDKYIGPSLKNCLCTIKLYKNKVSKKKKIKKATHLTVNTQTLSEATIGESVSRGTRTKREHHYKLLPYECEPYTCVPGECDPYICLQNIKRRELNTRNISVLTDKPDMRSMSSFTENSLKRSEAILVQPKFFRKGTKMESSHFKTLHGTSRSTGGSLINASESKQAVRIGSSFKFSIEFSKQLPGPVVLTKYPKIKQPLNVQPKMNKDKGITVTKVRVNYGDTRALEPRKVNRASFMRPTLKRCFCTLNLQKKTKQHFRKGKQETTNFGPKLYTVGRATTTKTEVISHSFGSQINNKDPKTKTISVSTSSFLLNKYVKSLKSTYETVRLYSTFKIPIRSKEPIVVKSNVSMKFDVIERVLSSKESWIRYIKRPLHTYSHVYINGKHDEYFNLFNKPFDQKLKNVTGISKYLERCFCTMNVQISSPGVMQEVKKNTYKLKPYECEPGICIPGECDPYECKKIIMRRFVKKVQKSSGTKSKSHSSYTTSNAGSDSRSTQMQTHRRNQSQVTLSQRYRLQRQREAKQRQAVRIKSSFSFDLEFYKHQYQPFEKYLNRVETNAYVVKPTNQKINRPVTKGTQKKYHSRGSKLQSNVVSYHKGTGAMSKRCFCTLKLQKKGRLHREHAKFNNIPPKQLPNITSRNVKTGTNAKYHQTPVGINDLKFYECEPGICVPGQCDPYKCLELMKNRKNFGINTIQKEKISVPSMTNEEKYKTRAIDTIPITTHKSTKTIKYIKKKLQNDNNIAHITSRTARSAVRIGSSFSFNIEFFKDIPKELQYRETNLKKREISNSDSMSIKDKKYTKNKKYTTDKKEIKAIISPSTKSVSYGSTVTKNPVNEKATTTTTEKLRSANMPENRNKKNLKLKCLCLLGLRNKENQGLEKLNRQIQKNDKYVPDKKKPDMKGKGNRNNQTEDKLVKIAEKPINIDIKHKLYSPYLEPYECEPGICVPGQCNPYICEKIIQQRLFKQHSKKSETESIRTHSASSSFGKYRRPKNEKTQAQGKTNKKQIQLLSKDFPPLNKKTNRSPARIGYLSEDVPSSNEKSINGDKRLVRIGSNFNFNIEFYKENVNNSVIRENIKNVKTSPNEEVHKRMPTGNVSKSIGTETVHAHRNKTQAKTKTKTSSVSPHLKRCFCTLKLMNKPIKQIDQNKKDTQMDTKPIVTTRTVETQSYKRLKGPTLQYDLGREYLSPYECEPFVCIPGQCDPVECLKRIEKRQHHTKEFGTITKYPKQKSIGSVATRMKNENSQMKYTMPRKSAQAKSYVEESHPEKSCYQPRQLVRIGSNFSFNIEFFKDFGDGLPNGVTTRPLEEFHNQKYSKKGTRHHTNTQPSHIKHNVGSQILFTKQRVKETATDHLKRCFCTLPLRNRNLNKQENTLQQIQDVQPKSNYSNAGDFLKKCLCTLRLNKVGKQQSQMPMPSVKYEIKGTQSRRAPRHFIKKPNRLLEPYECEPYVCIPGECDPYECLKRIQRRQVRDFGTDYKRYVKDSATDSIRQPVTRSTKAQYHLKHKFNSRGTSSLVSRRTRRSTEMAQFSYEPSPDTNRQVVRIGSNFSFNIDFFKEHVAADGKYEEIKAEKIPNINKLQFKQLKKPTAKSRGSISAVKQLHDKKSQFHSKRNTHSCSANIAPKRCFCTLKLLSNPNQPKFERKPIAPTISTKNKATATKVKYTIPQELGVYECPPLMCIPGECNPYECLEKIKRRQIMRKSRNVGTRAAMTSIASVGNGGLNVRAQKVQSHVTKRRNVIASTPHSEPQSEILKSARTIDNSERPNKCAVRIGSNFNFNVEFFKQKLQPAVTPVSKIVKDLNNEEDSKAYLNKKITAGTRNFGHSYESKIKLKDQVSGTKNSLKRCFCTLQLQKPSRHKMARVKNHRLGNNARYPQIFTVGRVEVEPFRHTVAKINQTKTVDKARSTSIHSKLLNRTVGTKTNKKYLNLPSPQCNPSNCPDYQKKASRGKAENDMKTILPFTPSKFNKESKTYLPTKNKLKENNTFDELKGEMVMGSRRLTAKKSKKSIPTHSVMDTKPNGEDSFFCRCVKFFSRKTIIRSENSDRPENTNINKRIDKSKSIPPKIKLTLLPKKAKSSGENCPYICPTDNKEQNKIYSILQSGDVNNSIMKPVIKPKMMTNKSNNQGGGKFVTFADDSEKPHNVMLRRKTNTSIYSKSRTRSKLCYSCSTNDCPLYKGDQQSTADFERHEKSIKKNKKNPSYSESANDCQYCSCCKRKIDTDEISKGGGDRRLTISSQYKDDSETCPCGKEALIQSKNKTHSVSEKSRADNLIKKYSMKTDKCCRKIKMGFDSDKHSITSKGKIKEKNKQTQNNSKLVEDIKPRILIKSKNNKFCICCKCLGKTEPKIQLSQNHDNCICCKCPRKGDTQEATTTIPTKAGKESKNKVGFLFPPKNINFINPFKPDQNIIGPCICGSEKCAKESKKKKTGEPQKETSKLIKTCVCGSAICNVESQKIKSERERKMNKAKFIKDEKERKALQHRVKIEEEKNAIRRHNRLKRNKELEKRVKQYKDASDLMLAIDSLTDIGKLGLSTVTDALRCTAKLATDPKVSCAICCKKCKKRDPESLLRQLQKDYMESDTASTMRRIKTRCLFMKKVQSLRQTLEENRLTHFILHFADKNAKTRRFIPKTERNIREPLDFQCSLYMATLRKRPYLSVYYKWPWFYPHFMSLLNVWRQFTDIMLFLLAVVVWSPCILCMEGCRALMCCFFCTG